MNLIEKYIGEAEKITPELETIRKIMGEVTFFSLRDPLKKAGFKNVGYANSPVPFYTLKTKSGKGYALMNKKYSDKAIFTVGEIAVEPF